MELKALVKSNDDVSLVFDNIEPLKYYKIDGLIYGTNSMLYECYYYDPPTERFKAFAGRKFNLKLESGEIIKCEGQWWDGGYNKLSEYLNVELRHTGANTINNLKRCYVYDAYNIDQEKKNDLVMNYKGSIYDYWEYGKLIKYDDLRKAESTQRLRFGKAKNHLIRKVKLMHRNLEGIKQLLPDKPNTIHYDIEYVELVNQIKEVINGEARKIQKETRRMETRKEIQ